jgi:transposase
MNVSSWSVRDDMWDVFRKLVPVRPPQRTGRPRIDDRIAFNAGMCVLITGVAWQHLPREMGCSPATAHRRLQEWQRRGLWQQLHRELLRRLNQAGRIEWSTGVVDGSHIRAMRGL